MSSTVPAMASAVRSSGPPDPNLVKIRDLIYKSAGIFHPDNKLRLLEDRIARRTRDLKVAGLREYLDILTQRLSAQQEMVKLLNEITIGETYFFRNQPQLDALKTIVLPRVLEARSKTPLRRLKFWSAGCSTGEEPYTLAIMLSEELNGLLKGWTFEITATDLNERSLEHAKQGLYGDYAIRNLTPALKQKYFTPQNERLQVNPSLKSLVNFSRLNLQDDTRMLFMKGMDVIFCCNVLIYFDVTSKRRVIQHFYTNLLSHGYLFLGHSESLYGVNDEFRLVHMPSATAYVRGDTRHVIGGAP